jgi:hypothetical protein
MATCHLIYCHLVDRHFFYCVSLKSYMVMLERMMLLMVMVEEFIKFRLKDLFMAVSEMVFEFKEHHL